MAQNSGTAANKDRASRTADFTCLARAMSFHEKSPLYHSSDNVAPRLVPNKIWLLINVPFFRRVFVRAAFPGGAYEYVIARTKFIDSVWAKAVAEGIEQIVIFGAGFDSRSLRLATGHNITVYEIDAPATQAAKVAQLRDRSLGVPDNVVFVPVDFSKDKANVRLIEAGFVPNRSTLFILEGLLMYLDAPAVDETFTAIRHLAGTGGRLVFDYVYASVIRGDNQTEGVAAVTERVKKVGEAWRFGLEPGDVETWLERFGLHLEESLPPDELARRYFTDTTGRLVGRMNGAHCLVTATVADVSRG